VSVGKFTSLEEVRKDPKLLKRFIKERVADGQGGGDEDKFEATLGSMLKSSPTAYPASQKANDADCSEIQTHPDTSGDVSRKR
jgi:hypothetical protein